MEKMIEKRKIYEKTYEGKIKDILYKKKIDKLMNNIGNREWFVDCLIDIGSYTNNINKQIKLDGILEKMEDNKHYYKYINIIYDLCDPGKRWERPDYKYIEFSDPESVESKWADEIIKADINYNNYLRYIKLERVLNYE